MEKLSEAECWQIIHLIDWEASSAKESMTKSVDYLSKRSNSCISSFHNWLTEKLFNLDTPDHAVNRRMENGYLSVDAFLYSRCLVVASGKLYYYQVLRNPTLFPRHEEYEHLLYFASDAYEIKTGKEFLPNSKVSYETYSNSLWDEYDGS